MSKLILSFKDITVRNHNQTIFEDLNFSIHKGEHWALTGPAGSGKTALLDTIAGKLQISKGETDHSFFDEQPAGEESAIFNWHRLIAQVSSRHHFRNLSNTSTFYYQQRFNSSDSEDAATVAQYLSAITNQINEGAWTCSRVTERLKLGTLLNKQLIKLSNGETKRLLIASALLKNPVLLLLDQPLTGLDVATRADFNELIGEIAASGIHIIMTTSPQEVPDAITHLAVLDQGRIKTAVAKVNFIPEKPLFASHRHVDTAELRRLLSIKEVHAYDNIVSMLAVHIQYGDKTILDQVSWTIKQGERWALLGANGAGKSTLLSLINGDNPQAYANHIVLFDRRRGSGESIWDIKKNIGFVSPELFQYFPAANSCLQVIESGFYDTLGLFRQFSPANAAIARQWMKLLEIEDVARTLFKNVPASIQRLCLLARALVKNPPLLIFDEPCQGLDDHQRDHFKHLVDEICNNSNVTLIYVSHYQEEIPDSVNHRLKLDKGQIAEIW